MKRTTGDMVSTAFFERNITVDNVDNIELFFDFFNFIGHWVILALKTITKI